MRRELTFPFFLAILLTLASIGISLSSTRVSKAAGSRATYAKTRERPSAKKESSAAAKARRESKAGVKRRQKPEQASKPLTKSLSIPAKGISLWFPDGWSVAQPTTNTWMIVNVAGDQQDTPTVRILIEYLERPDHADAVSELAEMATRSNKPSSFLAIGGWPALQRVELVKSLRSGEGPLADSMLIEITTSVAVGNLLVQLGADLPPDADQQLKDLVLAIGQSLTFKSVGDPVQVQRELQKLQGLPKRVASTPDLTGAAPADEGFAGVSVAAPNPVSPLKQLAMIGTSGELEVAVSNNARNIVVVKQDVWQTSNDGGQTFPFSNSLPGPGDGDSSIAFGQSGNFYHARLFGGSCPANTSCVEVATSTDGGRTFGALISPPGCPTTGMTTCSIDQEHIGADRTNAAAGGADNVYAAHRTCNASGNGCGSTTNPANIVCSNNSNAANSWSPRFALENAADFPRIAVGRDGMVYVVYVLFATNTIRIDKFNPCPASAPNTAPGVMTRAGGGFPKTVSGFTPFAGCEAANGFGGLDRCNDGNILSSPTVTVDDTNANHVYVAWANNTAANNENILVADSTDGGVTWRGPVTIQTNVNGRRYHPWVCAVSGNAFVTWYDRRAATATQNDTTDYYSASAGLNAAGNLVANNDEFKINTISDLQCDAAAWPFGAPRSTWDSENCSTQPQLAGQCSVTTATRCDYSDCGTCDNGLCAGTTNACTTNANCTRTAQCQCPAAESCNKGNPTPKYGDYDGNACIAGRLFTVFASATQTGVGGDPPPNVFFQAFLVAGPQIQVPGNVTFPDTCVGTTSTSTLNACNTGKADLHVNSITSNNTQFAVTTPSSGFPVTISPDFCFPFQVKFTPTSTGAQTATLTVNSDDPANPAVTVQASGNGIQQKISTVIADSGNFGDVCVGSFKDLALTISNSGGCDLLISNITSSSSQFLVASTMTFPVVIGPGDNLQVPIRFQPTSLGAKTGTITISSNDPTTPKLVAVSGNAPPGDIRVTGSTSFGDVCAGVVAEKTISVCNVGACNLHVTSATLNCPDFTLVNNPFPATVSPDSCLNLVIRFTPTSPGPKSCILTITSDDPDTPVVNLPVMANTPAASIDVPPDQGFPPEVIQSVGACSTLQPFPISNTGTCNLTVTNITIGGVNATDFGFSGLPSFPIILEPGHTVGDGDLMTVFAPTELDRDRLGTLAVTYVSNPINGATTTVTRSLCGEGVRTGARVLVTNAGVPVPFVEKIQIQRINGNRNKDIVDTVDNAMNLPLVTVTPSLPCMPFQYHREYGTVSNPIQLLPGSYQVTASAIINGKRKSLTVAFNVDTCDFNPTVVVNFP